MKRHLLLAGLSVLSLAGHFYFAYPGLPSGIHVRWKRLYSAVTWTVDIIFPVGFMQAISANQSGVFVGQFASLHYYDSRIYSGSVNLPESGMVEGNSLVYHNPASEKISVSGPFLKSVHVFTQDGRRVLSSEDHYGQELDISFLPEGAHVLHATTISGDAIRTKFIVQRR